MHIEIIKQVIERNMKSGLSAIDSLTEFDIRVKESTLHSSQLVSISMVALKDKDDDKKVFSIYCEIHQWSDATSIKLIFETKDDPYYSTAVNLRLPNSMINKEILIESVRAFYIAIKPLV